MTSAYRFKNAPIKVMTISVMEAKRLGGQNYRTEKLFNDRNGKFVGHAVKVDLRTHPGVHILIVEKIRYPTSKDPFDGLLLRNSMEEALLAVADA